MITLRKAEPKDCARIYEWRNHPKVRLFFFDSREISYAEHERWLRETLERSDRFLLVAQRMGEAVGVIRFDLKEGDPSAAEVDIYVAPGFQGQGMGKEILLKGAKWIEENTEIERLTARVKEENAASVKMFRGCGFRSRFIEFEKRIQAP